MLCTAKLRYFFNLGGDYAVELVFLPGHTLGPEPGDPYGQYATVSGFRQQLARLVARVDEFDGIFPGHGLVDLGTMMLVNILEACDRVLADPQNHDNKAEMTFGGTTFICYNKMIYQSGYLSYSPSGI